MCPNALSKYICIDFVDTKLNCPIYFALYVHLKLLKMLFSGVCTNPVFIFMKLSLIMTITLSVSLSLFYNYLNYHSFTRYSAKVNYFANGCLLNPIARNFNATILNTNEPSCALATPTGEAEWCVIMFTNGADIKYCDK